MPTLVSLAVVYRNLDSEGVELLMQKRTEGTSLRGLWEFPGGKIEPGEAPCQAAARELFEETGLEIESEDLTLFKPYRALGEKNKLILFICLSRYRDQDQSLKKIEGKGKKKEKKEWKRLNFRSPLDFLTSPSEAIMPANGPIIRDIMVHLESESQYLSKELN